MGAPAVAALVVAAGVPEVARVVEAAEVVAATEVSCEGVSGERRGEIGRTAAVVATTLPVG